MSISGPKDKVNAALNTRFSDRRAIESIDQPKTNVLSNKYVFSKETELKEATVALQSLLKYLNLNLDVKMGSLNGEPQIAVYDNESEQVIKTINYNQLKSLLNGRYVMSEKV
ncbi:hypothetical protein [Vibrio sp. HN007]|uniref:hypothetical protein n=1 Tax=Vibrio iocasae TaxID=3098914 RepID=UPI0035D41F29